MVSPVKAPAGDQAASRVVNRSTNQAVRTGGRPSATRRCQWWREKLAPRKRARQAPTLPIAVLERPEIQLGKPRHARRAGLRRVAAAAAAAARHTAGRAGQRRRRRRDLRLRRRRRAAALEARGAAAPAAPLARRVIVGVCGRGRAARDGWKRRAAARAGALKRGRLRGAVRVHAIQRRAQIAAMVVAEIGRSRQQGGGATEAACASNRRVFA